MLDAYSTDFRNEAYVYLADASDMSIVTSVAFALAEADHPGALTPLIRVDMGRKRKDARRARGYLNQKEEMRDVGRICDLVRSSHPVVFGTSTG